MSAAERYRRGQAARMREYRARTGRTRTARVDLAALGGMLADLATLIGKLDAIAAETDDGLPVSAAIEAAVDREERRAALLAEVDDVYRRAVWALGGDVVAQARAAHTATQLVATEVVHGEAS